LNGDEHVPDGLVAQAGDEGAEVRHDLLGRGVD
jgi:hypothetical protein